MKFSRPPIYKSARAVPSSPSGKSSPPRISAVRAIQLLLLATALAMAITTLVHIYPMFHAVDSTVRAHLEDGELAKRPVLSDKRPHPGAEMHHGVHTNLMEHRKSLREHLEKQHEKKMQQKAAKIEATDKSTGDGQSSAEELNQVKTHPSIRAKPLTKPSKVVVKPAKTLDAGTRREKATGGGGQSSSSIEKGNQAKDSSISAKPPAKAMEPAENPDAGTQFDGLLEKEIEFGSHQDAPKSQANPVLQKLARGHSGLPMEKTPALVGAKRGTIACDVDVK